MYTIIFIMLLACEDSTSPASSPTPSPQVTMADEKATKAPPKVQESQDKPLPPVTAKNWKGHSKIVEIRDLVSDIHKKQENKESGWSTEQQKFSDGCGEEFIYETSVWKDPKGNVRSFSLVEGRGDIFRESTHFYDDTGKARFLMSTYVHSSAESKYLSRLYLNADGSILFTPELEQLSKPKGPQDDTKIQDQLIPMASAAAAKHAKLMTSCKK